MTSSSPAPQKSLLLRAWRERWSDIQWSIHAKRLLNSGQCDAATLADLLMTQAFAQSSPNMLILNYIKHAISTQMITVSSVIAFIVKYDDIGKMFCTRALLELTENFTKRASIAGNYEDSLQVAKAFFSLLLWLLELGNKCCAKIVEDKMAAEYCGLLEKMVSVVMVMKSNRCTVGMLYIARLDDPEQYSELKQQLSKLLPSVGKVSNKHLPAEGRRRLEEAVAIVNQLEVIEHPASTVVDMSEQQLNPTLNVLLNIEAILHPTHDIEPLVQQILIVHTTQGLSRPRLYCELIRTCLIGMIDSVGGNEELRWAAFTFLKMPQVLAKLTSAPDSTGGTTQSSSSVDLLIEGFQLLLNYGPLLDLADTKCGADCLSFLLKEIQGKMGLLSEAQSTALMQRRVSESRKPVKATEQQNSQPSAGLILRAEPTVTSILKTLDADYSKNQDALLGVLCHMMSGKSFELILAAAAATGKLQSFAVKLIKFNEFSKQCASAEGEKGATTRSLLFDISFLMLCHITQLYGTEIVCGPSDSASSTTSSFFLQWATRCLPEASGKFKSPELFVPADTGRVEAILQQLSPGEEIKFNGTRWQDVCHQAPHAVQEILTAWELGCLSEQEVNAMLTSAKSRMCCMPVVVAVALCSYMNTVSAATRRKPLAMLAQLTAALEAQPKEQYYTERYQLMKHILSRVTSDILPVDQRQVPAHEIPANTPAYTMLSETFREIFRLGRINIVATRKMEFLLRLTGPQWFSRYIVLEVLHYERPEDLRRALGIAFALFNLDLEKLVLALVTHTVPNMLQAGGSRVSQLTNPKGQTLAQLTVLSLLLLHNHMAVTKDLSPSDTKRGRKRTHSEDSAMEDDERPTKLRKLPSDDPFSLATGVDGFDFGEMPSNESMEGSPEKGNSPPYDTKDPFNKALVSLFRLLSAILNQPTLSQRSGFVVSFIEQVLKAGSRSARVILQFLPQQMVSQLMKFSQGTFTTDVLLTLCDLTSPPGRKAAAKVLAQASRTLPQTVQASA